MKSLTWQNLFVLGSILGVTISLILASFTVLVLGSPRPDTLRINIRTSYETQLASVEQSLLHITEKKLSVIDKPELVNLRERLMSWLVPAEAKEFHLALILKLQQIENVLSQQTANMDMSLQKLQTDLRTLVTNKGW